MSKEKEKLETKEEGEQLDLIDVHPENAKEILAAARLYQKHQSDRIKAGVKEAEQKQLILELVKKENLQTLVGGKVRFELDGVLISITPRDELVQITEKRKVAIAKE